MKYDYKHYLKYRRKMKAQLKADGDGGQPVSYKMWKIVQPIADSVIGKVNNIIDKQKIK